MREILDEQTIYEQRSYRQIRRYIRGWYPEEGKLTYGWGGRETIVERDVIKPIRTFYVRPTETTSRRT